MKKKNLVRVTALCVAGVLALGGCAQQGAESQEGDQVVLKVGGQPLAPRGDSPAGGAHSGKGGH